MGLCKKCFAILFSVVGIFASIYLVIDAILFEKQIVDAFPTMFNTK